MMHQTPYTHSLSSSVECGPLVHPANQQGVMWRRACTEPTAMLAHADWRDAALSLPPQSIDLVYVDPPFMTGSTLADRAGSFGDAWASMDDYCAWLHERLRNTIPLLKPSASILLHLDWRTSHRARAILDELLGTDRFVNHLIWSYGLGGSSPRRFARKHDDILLYCIHPDRYYFDPPMIPATSRRMAGKMKKATDVLDIPALNNMAHERTGWPTQKPLALLKLLINACSPQDGTTFDPCCGSGTTLVGAIQSGRACFGCDCNADAVALTAHRLREARGASSGASPLAGIRA